MVRFGLASGSCDASSILILIHGNRILSCQGVNPARTFGPSMVDCMAGVCSSVVKSSYWIYWLGPFAASLTVAEVTEWMSLDLDEVNTQNKPGLDGVTGHVKDAESVDATTIGLPPLESP